MGTILFSRVQNGQTDSARLVLGWTGVCSGCGRTWVRRDAMR